MYIYIYMSMNAEMPACDILQARDVYMCVCVYVCIYICTYICID